MSALRFAHPEWLLPLASVLLALLLALGLANAISRRRRALLLGKLGGRVAHRALTSDLALLLAAAAVAVALLGPRIGERVVRVPATGVDVVFALDVSRSMDAVDVPPSRLARARRAVSELLARLEREDRVSLAAYAGVGVLLTPLTPDRDVLLELLSGVDTQLVIPGSSHLAAGVRSALEAFEAGSERPRLLVVLSDGEDPERRGDLAASEALRAGVRVLAIAFGTEVGATVPDHGVALLDRWGRFAGPLGSHGRVASRSRTAHGAGERHRRTGLPRRRVGPDRLRRGRARDPARRRQRARRAGRAPGERSASAALCCPGLRDPAAGWASAFAPALAPRRATGGRHEQRAARRRAVAGGRHGAGAHGP